MRARSIPNALVVAGLLGLLTALPAHAATHAITMANYAFSPANETIALGDTVTWTNTDQAPHDVTVTSGPVAIHSPTITTGQSWTYTFTMAGTYSYICSIHPDMHATLVVAPAPPTTQAAAPPPVPVQRPVTPTRTVARPTPIPAQAPAPATSVPTTSAAAAVPPPTQPPAPTQPVVAAQSAQQPSLNPLLLVAGLVAAVATLCLLLLGSRPEKQQE